MYKKIVRDLKLKVENTLKKVPKLAQQTMHHMPRCLNTDTDIMKSYYPDDGKFICYDSKTLRLLPTGDNILFDE